MRFIFDPDKDELNLAKHDLSLSFAEKLIWDEAYVWVDPRFSYDELRMIGLVPEGNTLYYVAFVDRGDVRRTISLRPCRTTRGKKICRKHPVSGSS